MTEDLAFLMLSKKWTDHTAEFSLAEKGAIMELLIYQNRHKSLPITTVKLAKIIGVSEAEFMILWSEIKPLFSVVPTEFVTYEPNRSTEFQPNLTESTELTEFGQNNRILTESDRINRIRLTELTESTESDKSGKFGYLSGNLTELTESDRIRLHPTISVVDRFVCTFYVEHLTELDFINNRKQPNLTESTEFGQPNQPNRSTEFKIRSKSVKQPTEIRSATNRILGCFAVLIRSAKTVPPEIKMKIKEAFHFADFQSIPQDIVRAKLEEWFDARLTEFGHRRTRKSARPVQPNSVSSVNSVAYIDTHARVNTVNINSVLRDREDSIGGMGEKEEGKEGDEPNPPKIDPPTEPVLSEVMGWNLKPFPDDLNGLPKHYAEVAVEYVFRLQKIVVSEDDMHGLWEPFKKQHMNGENRYADQNSVYNHFTNWVKYQKFSNGTKFEPTEGGKRAAGGRKTGIDHIKEYSFTEAAARARIPHDSEG